MSQLEILRETETRLSALLHRSYTEGTTRPTTTLEIELRRVRQEILKLESNNGK